jgi:hypothetical protein
MPQLNLTGADRIVTIVINGTNMYPYSYSDSNLVNIIPLYLDGQKYYHFTGHSLQNIQYIEFVTANVSTMSANKIAVRNVTETSFDATIPSPPLNIARCLLMDSFGNLTTEDADYFTLSSETCFPGDTPILTDQGIIAISKINPDIHTIRSNPIISVTKTVSKEKYLICFGKDALYKNIPSQDTIMSQNHRIFYKGQMIKANDFLYKFENVKRVKYNGEFLYNILLEIHDKMEVNNLICETLKPTCDIAILYKKVESLTPEQKWKIMNTINEYNEYNEYNETNEYNKYNEYNEYNESNK